MALDTERFCQVFLAQSGGNWPAVVVGTVAAAMSGYAAIAWLLRYLGRKNLTLFAGYRVVLGLALVIMIASGVLLP